MKIAAVLLISLLFAVPMRADEIADISEVPLAVILPSSGASGYRVKHNDALLIWRKAYRWSSSHREEPKLIKWFPDKWEALKWLNSKKDDREDKMLWYQFDGLYELHEVEIELEKGKWEESR